MREGFRSLDALLFLGAEASGVYGLADQRKRSALIQSLNGRPFSGALLAGSVEYMIDCVFAVFVSVAENVAGDLYQVAVELSLIPASEHIVHLFVRKAEPVF